MSPKNCCNGADPARRRAQADDRRRLIRVAPLPRAIARILARLVGRRGIEGWILFSLRHEFVGNGCRFSRA